MSTNKLIEANRLNAIKSTGPRTIQGKAISSMNHLRTGLYAGTVLLPGESQAEFDQLRAGYLSLYSPQDDAQRELVDRLAATKWKMSRTELLEAGILVEHGDHPASQCLPLYDRVLQVQGRLQRLWIKLFKELEAIKAARKKPIEMPKSGASKQPAASAQADGASAPNDEQWAMPDEWRRQTGAERNFKRPKFLEVTWTPVQGEPPRLISRIYKGKNVPEWPADDQPTEDMICHRRL